MKNNQLLPFERNRYYIGKLLTSADFQAEQAYGTQKRRFLNGMMFGDGVVCGLGVYSLDDQSIMIDSGVAIDGWGREIVVESTVVRKLSAIAGFDELSGDKAALCLRYYEENVHPVYAVRGEEDGEGYECNRIREGYEIFLTNAEILDTDNEPESEFLSSSVLFENDRYSVTLSMPAVASCGRPVCLEVTVTGCGKGNTAPLSLDARLQTPAFFGEHGEHEVHIVLEDIVLAEGETRTKAYWMTAQPLPAAGSVLMISADSSEIQVGEQQESMPENFMMKVSVEDATPDQLVARAIGHISLETREMAGQREFVPLAEIMMHRTKEAYLIERVEENQYKKFIPTAAASAMRTRYQAYFASDGTARLPQSADGMHSDSKPEEGARYKEPSYATGVCEIPLSGLRRGQITYSDEIIHGLGTGNVFVQVGAEYLCNDVRLGGQSRNTIYGNTQLFAQDNLPVTYAETAVKVMCDRGSFVVAAQLTQDTVQVVLTLRWVAIRLPIGEETSKIQKLAGKSIAAEHPTVVLATRESYFFNVKFKNMEQCTLSYELTEKDSGEITTDGIYTAPGKEGVYEIRISCADMPLISTYAYAVVKKRTGDSEDEPAVADAK